MPKTDDFNITFERLKAIFEPYCAKLNVVSDTPNSYDLATDHVMKNKQKLWFGGVRMGKAYVSFHLMPVYGMPKLIENMSPELRKRMQGKSCFNFTRVDEKLFKELAKLTKAGFKAFNSPDVLRSIGITSNV